MDRNYKRDDRRRVFSGVAVSGDGNRIFGTTYIGFVWRSLDAGVSFAKVTETVRGCSGVASDVAGSTVLVVVFGGQMYQFT